jgi:hypothetical protein
MRTLCARVYFNPYILSVLRVLQGDSMAAAEIRKLGASLGLTQEEFVNKIGASRGRWRNGRSASIRPRIVSAALEKLKARTKMK